MLTQKTPLSLFAVVAGALLAAGCSTGPTQSAPAPGPVVTHSRYALTPGCGNGVLEPERGEGCDDGNVSSGDGCSASCAIEAGFVCVGERPSTCTSPDQSDAPASYGYAQHGRALPPVSPFVGRDFWTDFPTNAATPTSLALKIAGAAGTTGQVLNTAGTSIAAFTIPAGGVSTVTVPVATYHVTTNNAVLSQGVHVTASGEIRVLATNESTYTTDTWALWATEKLGTDYIVLDSAASAFGWELNLIATQNGTTAVIKNVAGVTQATVSLNAGQNYQFASSSAIVGYTVTSNYPLAVLAGTMCTNDVGAACDMTAEQLAPVRNWARDYAVAPTYNTTNGRANHTVVASQDNTTVIVTRSDGTQSTYTLNARESARFATSDATQSGYFISADKPVGVASNVGAPGSVWDPSLVTWPPLDGYVSDAKMPTSGNELVFTNFLSLITRTSATSEILVNGVAVGGWVAISTTGYSFTQVAVPAGDNTIHGNNGVTFGAVAVGGEQAVSYAYSSPYDIATVGGTTNCYLGTNAPDYEAALAGSAASDQDDTAATDDEDALTWPTSAQLNASSVSLAVPCNDNYFGVDVTATVHGWIDFNQNGTFEASEHASAGCVDSSPSTNGSAALVFASPPWNALGTTTARLRVCDSSADCSAATGSVASGEVEDHLVHIGQCGDGFVDTFDACDDGNTSDADGCSATCTVESGFVCSGNPSVCLLNQAPAITTPADNALLTTATPTLGGTCVTGATVRAREGATVLCSTACVGAAWSCTSAALTEGSHFIVADQNIAGQTSVPSAARTLRIDTQPPLAPVLVSPVSGSSTNDTTPTITGTCEAGAAVTVAGFCSASCAIDGTFSCTASTQTDGVKTLTATQVDVGGNTSPASNSVTLTIDTAPPATPTITAPAEGVDPGTAYPVFTGACETGAAVRLVENLNTVLCTTTCTASAYSCTSSALGVGSHTVQARQTDAAGNQSPFSAQRTFPITALPNQPPTITAPTQGAVTNDTTPTIGLTCTTGNPVTVYEGATVLCSGTCAASAYSCTPTLSEGAHGITATQTMGGTESDPSATRDFTIDSLAPAAPALTAPAALSAVFTTTPAFSGSCETGATVEVLEGATVLCTATCAGSAFTCTSSALALGGHTVSARQSDPAGNLSPSSSELTFGVAVCGNSTLELGEGCDDANATPGDGCSALCQPEPGFSCGAAGATCVANCGDSIQTSAEECDDGDTTPGDGCSATCTIEPGFLCGSTATNLVVNGGFDQGNTGFTSTLTYLAVGPNSAENQYGLSVGNAWRPDLCVGVPDGERSLGNTSMYFNAGPDSSQIIYQTTVNLTAGLDYLIEARAMSWTALAPPRLFVTLGSTPLSGEFQAVVCGPSTPWTRLSTTYHAPTTGPVTLTVYNRETAFTGNDGALDGFSVTQVVPTTCTRPTLGALPTINGTNAATYPVSGTCLSTAGDVTVSVGGVEASASCGGGTFSVTLDVSGLADGPSIAVTATQQNASGSASASGSTSKDTVVTPPTFSAPSAGAFLSTNTPTAAGSCESGATVTVSEGLTPVCTSACLSGAFSCTTSALGEGLHSLVATQLDAAGNQSGPSAPRAFTVDTVAPQPVVLTAPTPGLRTNSVTPTVSGQCETGTLVTVAEGATTVCSAICVSASFSCQTSALSEGAHTLSAIQTDAALNPSTASTVALVVDLTPPAAPTVTTPPAGTFLSDATPTVGGACESDATVTASEGGTSWCTTTCVSSAWSCDATAVADGSHTVTATQTDVAGNASAASSGLTFVVDTQVVAPTFSAPVEGAFLSTQTPALSGACEDGAAVTVSEGGTERCTASCAAGAWTCTSGSVAEGPHTFTVTQVDHAGNVSTGSSRSFTLDVTAPAAPTVSSPHDGDFVRAQHQLFTGGCEDAATVEVREGTTVLCSATCASSSYSCDTGTMPEGAHPLTVRQIDRAGNPGVDSATLSVTFDVTEPSAPVIVSPVADAKVATATPQVSGTCEAFATVEVSEGSSPRCATTCSDSGTFSCVSTSMADGAHTLEALQTDRAGNPSPTTSVSLSIDTTVPPLPVLTAPARDALLGAQPVFEGTGEAGSTVIVLVDGVERCRVAVDGAGTWSCAPTSPLADGAHLAQLIGYDELANTSAITDGSPFRLDTVAPRAPSILTPASMQVVGAWPSLGGRGEPGSTLRLTIDGEERCLVTVSAAGTWACVSSAALVSGAHEAVARATDAAGGVSEPSVAVTFTVSTTAVPGAPVLTAPVEGGAVTTPTPSFTGRAEPAASVVVTVDGVEVCTVVAEADATFTCASSVSLPDGAHAAVARASNANGVSPGSPPLHFTVDTVVPEAPVLTAPAADATVNPWPVFRGTAEASAWVTVTVDSAPGCAARADRTGHFACLGAAALSTGAHQAQAQARDAAGNQSEASAVTSFTVDPAALPSPPVILAPTEGAVLHGSSVSFSGRAEPGSHVTVRQDGTTACEAVASASGDWTCTVSSVSDGAHAFDATTSTGAGTSVASPSLNVVVDTVAPAAPSLTSPAASAAVGPSPAFGGTAEALATVRISVDGREVCSTTASVGGAFECFASQPLLEGAHTATAVAVDGAGWESASSPSVPFTVSARVPTIVTPARDALVHTAKPQFLGAAEAGARVRVSVDGQVVCEARADGAGAWTCTPAEAQSEGLHQVKATADDGYGTVKETAQQPLTIDTVAPAVPVLTAPANGAVDLLGGSVTFAGTAEPRSQVEVKVDGQTVCTALVDATGHWTCVATGLQGARHEVQVRTTDPATNSSAWSTASVFTNVTQLDPPTVSGPTAGSEVIGPTVPFSGHATPGTTVTVNDETGATVCTAAAAADGSWSCEGTVAAGVHAFTTTTSWNGIESSASSPVSITVLDDAHFAGGLSCAALPASSAWSLLGLAFLSGALRRRRR